MNKPTKDVLLQYVYDFGLEETARLLKITPNEIDKILNPINETIYIHKQSYKPVTINSTVAEVIANNYDRLRTKFVGNTTNLALSQTDEDIFHNTLLKVMEEPDVIEDKILEHIEYRINMVRFQTKMDNKLLKKVITNAIPAETKQTATEEIY